MTLIAEILSFIIELNIMSRFNVYGWNYKRRLAEVEEQFEVRAFVVMLGKGMQLGPAKVFTDRAAAEAYAKEEKKSYEDRFGETLTTQVRDVPIG